MLDMSLDAAMELAVRESYPTIMEADMEGCRFENGKVHVPEAYHRLKELFDRGDWPSLDSRQDSGGQGLPLSAWLPLVEPFMPNASFMWLMNKPFSGTRAIEMFGTDEQKEKYLKKLVIGQWGSVVAVNEDDSGCDASMLTTVAVKTPDGSYRIKGIKDPITGGDSDLFENLIHIVLARVEGDPPDQPTLFIVPKYRVNGDGTPGTTNDITVVELQDKMGFKGSPTCRVDYGGNDDCHGELLGERGQAMMMVLPLLQNGFMCCGIQAAAAASAAYLHALDHAGKRKQGASLENVQDPHAPRVSIIAHPDVRRMLMEMKSRVEGMRALLYFTGLCSDKAGASAGTDGAAEWEALRNMLMPLCRVFTAEAAFRVCETAIQVHGRFGYLKGSPVEQFIRDVKVQSIWELTTGLHALMFVAQTMPANDGGDFAALLSRMNQTMDAFEKTSGIEDLAVDVKSSVALLGGMGMFFAECGQGGNIITPVFNATPFMRLMGHVCLGWLHFWQAGIAADKLGAIFKENGLDPSDKGKRDELTLRNREAAFYEGKLWSARYYIKNILPRTKALDIAIKSRDLSGMGIPDNCF
jgi:alkylation response protein AidB-like acyl-CoA dehydrogenase